MRLVRERVGQDRSAGGAREIGRDLMVEHGLLAASQLEVQHAASDVRMNPILDIGHEQHRLIHGGEGAVRVPARPQQLPANVLDATADPWVGGGCRLQRSQRGVHIPEAAMMREAHGDGHGQRCSHRRCGRMRPSKGELGIRVGRHGGSVRGIRGGVAVACRPGDGGADARREPFASDPVRGGVELLGRDLPKRLRQAEADPAVAGLDPPHKRDIQ